MEDNSTNTSNDSCSIFGERRYTNVAIINAILSGVSLLACLLSLFVILLFKKWKFFNQRLVLYLIISATLLSLAVVMHKTDYTSDYDGNNRRFCIFTGFSSHLALWMIIDAITAVTLYVFFIGVFNVFTEKYEYAYVFFIFVFPFTHAWIPFIKDAYGRSGVWCWIRTVDPINCKPFKFGVVLQLVLFYVPFFLILAILVALYLITLCKLHRKSKHWKAGLETSQHVDKVLKAEVHNLLVYPVIFIILFLPLIANRILSWAEPGKPSLVLWYLSGICQPLVGIIFVLAFTLDADTRRRLNWAHLRAAFRNYHSKKVVSEYQLGEEEAVPYHKITDRTVMEEIVIKDKK